MPNFVIVKRSAGSAANNLWMWALCGVAIAYMVTAALKRLNADKPKRRSEDTARRQ